MPKAYSEATFTCESIIQYCDSNSQNNKIKLSKSTKNIDKVLKYI